MNKFTKIENEEERTPVWLITLVILAVLGVLAVLLVFFFSSFTT